MGKSYKLMQSIYEYSYGKGKGSLSGSSQNFSPDFTIPPLIIGNSPTLTNWAFWIMLVTRTRVRMVIISSQLPIYAELMAAHVEPYYNVSPELSNLDQCWDLNPYLYHGR